MPELIPVGPGIKDPASAAVLKSHEDAIRSLQNPGAPEQCAEIDTAANLALRLPPADWPNCRIIVTDKNCLAISTNVAGTWTWLRSDGGAL
jgi:hypothetical protein